MFASDELPMMHQFLSLSDRVSAALHRTPQPTDDGLAPLSMYTNSDLCVHCTRVDLHFNTLTLGLTDSISSKVLMFTRLFLRPFRNLFWSIWRHIKRIVVQTTD